MDHCLLFLCVDKYTDVCVTLSDVHSAASRAHQWLYSSAAESLPSVHSDFPASGAEFAGEVFLQFASPPQK